MVVLVVVVVVVVVVLLLPLEEVLLLVLPAVLAAILAVVAGVLVMRRIRTGGTLRQRRAAVMRTLNMHTRLAGAMDAMVRAAVRVWATLATVIWRAAKMSRVSTPLASRPDTTGKATAGPLTICCLTTLTSRTRTAAARRNMAIHTRTAHPALTANISALLPQG